MRCTLAILLSGDVVKMVFYEFCFKCPQVLLGEEGSLFSDSQDLSQLNSSILGNSVNRNLKLYFVASRLRFRLGFITWN